VTESAGFVLLCPSAAFSGLLLPSHGMCWDRWSEHRGGQTSTSREALLSLPLETAFQKWRTDHEMGSVLRLWQREVPRRTFPLFPVPSIPPPHHCLITPLSTSGMPAWQDPVKSSWARMGHRISINPLIRRRKTTSTSPAVAESESPPRNGPSPPLRCEGGLGGAFRTWRTERELGSVWRLWRHEEDPVAAGAKHNWSRMGRKMSVNPIIRRRATAGGTSCSFNAPPVQQPGSSENLLPQVG